jgi:peptide/nickel transport system permease protein
VKRYILQRLGQLVIVMFAVSLISFALIRQIPGVKIEIVIAGPGANEQQVAEISKQWGLDKSIPEQYVIWLKNMATGDLGRSSAFNVGVADLIKDRLPNSLRLMVYAQFISLLVAIPLGMIAAYRVNSRTDRAISISSFAFLSFPPVVAGPILVYLFAVRWGWLPAIFSDVGFFESPWEHVKTWLLPSLVLSFSIVAGYLRLLRSDMAATLQSDFITMARAKGLTTTHILTRHALRPSLFSLMTAAAINIGALIGGSVVVETIFALPGMGDLAVQAIFRRDLQVFQLVVVISALLFVVLNFLVDLFYAVVDPRVRHARALS